MIHLPFDIEVYGDFPPANVRVLFDPAPRATTPELEALIDAEWTRQTALAANTNRLLFNGELLRHVRHRIVDGPAPTFEMTVGPTCYRDFVGTNLYNNRRIAEFGRERFSNPVGTTATLITGDGRIVYGRRSDRVAFHADHVHTFGGALEASDRAADGTIDAFASLYRELWEEVGLTRDELSETTCVGLIRDREILQPEMLFEAKVALSADELKARWESAESRDEHAELIDFEDGPDRIVPFILGCGPIAPVATAALMLHGRRRWGEAWLTQAAAQLTTKD